MKKSRFSDSQILSILKQAENGVPVPELCREHGMSSASFYQWRAKFGGMDASMMARLEELEDENRRLKKCTPRSDSSRAFSRKPSKKVVKPSRRREMAQKAVQLEALQYSPGLLGVQHQRDRLSLPGKAQ